MFRKKKSLREILLSMGGVELSGLDELLYRDTEAQRHQGPTESMILTIANTQRPTSEPVSFDDVESDPDDPNERPVRFDPETGKRLKPGSPEHATAAERFDIQQDEHFCIWCGESISIHYTGWSQWIDCGTLRRWRKGTARRTEGGCGHD